MANENGLTVDLNKLIDKPKKIEKAVAAFVQGMFEGIGNGFIILGKNIFFWMFLILTLVFLYIFKNPSIPAEEKQSKEDKKTIEVQKNAEITKSQR